MLQSAVPPHYGGFPSPRGGELKSCRENRGRKAAPQRGLREPAAHTVRTAAKYNHLTSFEKLPSRHAGLDPASSGIKYRSASELEVTGFRVKRGMTINKRFFKKLNEYNSKISAKPRRVRIANLRRLFNVHPYSTTAPPQNKFRRLRHRPRAGVS